MERRAWFWNYSSLGNLGSHFSVTFVSFLKILIVLWDWVPACVESRLTGIEIGSHDGWLTINAQLQDQSTTRMRTAQCDYITTTRTQYKITIHCSLQEWHLSPCQQNTTSKLLLKEKKCSRHGCCSHHYFLTQIPGSWYQTCAMDHGPIGLLVSTPMYKSQK